MCRPLLKPESIQMGWIDASASEVDRLQETFLKIGQHFWEKVIWVL